MQSGFMKDRRICDNIIKLTNLMDYCKRRKIRALLISFDFQKAFDTVEWDAIDQTLDFCNFGPVFRAAVRTLYQNIYSCSLNNRYLSEWFGLSHSCCQGCPISPSLFNLIAEVLGDKIRNNNKIKGVPEAKFEKGAQYADNLWLIVEANQENVNEILNELNNFHKFSGLKTNPTKTLVVRIGHWPDMSVKFDTVTRLKWTNEPIKILGIMVHPDQDCKGMEVGDAGFSLCGGLVKTMKSLSAF